MTQRNNTSVIYAWYVVVVLMLTYMVALIDRQILSLMIDPVRIDLVLSDTEISLLHGFAFALFYSIFGVFLGWIADVWNRRNLIFLGLALWGMATVASGLASSFAWLFMARMVVGIGEATLAPAAYSVIYDYFEPESRGRAMSVYGIGVVFGAGAAYIVGGTVVEFGDLLISWFMDSESSFMKPWRAAFIVVGVMSLVVLAFIATIKEPVRRKSDLATEDTEKPNPIYCARYILSNVQFHGKLILGLSIGAIVFNGIFAWVPSHFIRLFDWSPSQIGLAFGTILFVFGASGMWFGGYMSDRISRTGRLDGPALVVLLGELVGGTCAALFGFAPSPTHAILALCGCVFAFSAAIALGPVALQSLTPATIRSQMIALYLLTVNILGLGLGPTLIASVSDYILQNEKLIGMAVSIVAIGVMPIASYLLFDAWKWQCRVKADG